MFQFFTVLKKWKKLCGYDYKITSKQHQKKFVAPQKTLLWDCRQIFPRKIWSQCLIQSIIVYKIAFSPKNLEHCYVPKHPTETPVCPALGGGPLYLPYRSLSKGFSELLHPKFSHLLFWQSILFQHYLQQVTCILLHHQIEYPLFHQRWF